MSEIVSKFNKFNTENDIREVVESYRHGVPLAAFGVPFGVKCYLLTLMEGKILYVVKDFLEAEKTAKELSGLTTKKVAVLYEREEVLLTSKAFSKDAQFKRIKGIVSANSDAEIIVATLPAIMGLYPTNLKVLSLQKGNEYDVIELEKELVLMGYVKVPLCEANGTFARRGDIFDIYPVGEDNPVRIDFFGDEIERIKVYNVEDNNTLSLVQSVSVIPATEINYKEDDLSQLNKQIDEEYRNFNGKKNERFSEFCQEVKENLLQKNYDQLTSVIPLLSTFAPIYDAINFDAVIYSEPRVLHDVLDAIYKEHNERFYALYNEGEVFDADKYQLVSPEELIIGFNKKRLVAFQALTADVRFFNPLKIINVKSSPSPKYLGKYKDLVNDVRAWVDNHYTVELFTGDIERAQKLSEDLWADGIPVGKGVTVTPSTMPEGFICHGLKAVAIGSDDIYLKPKKKEKRSKQKTKVFFSAPVAGDYAVHEIHGIGKVIGNKKLTTGLGTKDYVAVAYKGGDILYVPVEQLDALTRYVGGEKEPSLSKIGGKDFDRIKQRVRESLRQLSFDLKKLYEERSRKNGYEFEEAEDLQDAFDGAFGFEDTPDQISANEDIREDMCSRKVMDRLLCGDVGFGKTEVAFRAVFRAVINGKQAVMLAPTTILAEQHFNTAKKRFADFSINIESLDRFKTKKQQSEVLQKLSEGKIDFIIGTHRLLSSDVKFKDLGLLVLDEEQRFGVEHKEKIKTLKNNVDTLTLTATPIPRTLHMSLSGIRDISTINTPPKERLPVQTYVTEQTDVLITDAVRREVMRGGQVFILYNRVETIDHFAEKIKSLLPSIKLTVAHGQMDEKTLERSISEFYRGETDVLLATTIIENGIDLPKANTIIVIDADLLGLSTLYQLRGRVGRSNRLAHAYFTFKREKVLSDVAYKRLSSLMEFTEMGSGFKIAMRDLEIRGAGNVLGAQQHGHLDKVGYELYSKLLKEELEGGKEEQFIDLDVKVSAYIPDEYIENANGRMDAYKEIAEISSKEEADEVLALLEDTYGDAPLETINLIKIALIKKMLKDIGATAFYVGKNDAFFGFKNLKSLENERLLDAVSDNKRASLSMSGGVGIKFDRTDLDGFDTLNMLIEFLEKATFKDAVFDE